MNLKPTRVVVDDDLIATTRRLFEEHSGAEVVRASETGDVPGDLWRRAAAAGLPFVGLSDGESGGFVEAAAVLHAAGRSTVPLPLAETGLIGGWLRTQAGWEVDDRPLTVPIPDPADTVTIAREGDGWRLAGRWNVVPWAAFAAELVALVASTDGATLAVRVPGSALRVEPSRGIGNESRDIVDVDVALGASEAVPVGDEVAPQLRARAALSRAALMAGAMERCVELAADYAKVRVQFGKPIGRFQAVQALLSVAAEQTALAVAAVDIAAAALDEDPTDPFRTVEAARVVGHEAQFLVTANTHQAFGAIGSTREHELHFRTNRIWQWDAEWATPIDVAADYGRWFIDGGADQLWNRLLRL